MVNTLVLAIPDFSKPFVLETDASDIGFGAVGSHHIAYLSIPVCLKNHALSTYEKECMDIILAIEKWRPYLHNGEFTIRTGNRTLLHLTDQMITCKIQLKLMDLQYRIVYKKGALIWLQMLYPGVIHLNQ